MFLSKPSALLLLCLLLLTTVVPALATPEPSEYTVDEGDILSITVYGHEDMTTRVRVSGGGDITYPLLGTVKVAGLTTRQISDKLTDALADGYLVTPQVNVFIETFRVQNVFISGQVNKPAAYQFEQDMTLIKLVTLAGGFTDLAATRRVKIIRKKDGKEITIDRARMDEPVRPGDIIVVPESFF